MMINTVVIVNKVTGEQLELDTKHTRQYILDELAIDPVSGVITMQDLIALDGASISNIKYGTRTAAITGWVVGQDDAEISSHRRLLNRLINPKQPIELVFNGYKLTGVPTSSIVYGTKNAVINEKMTKFYFSILADNPLIQTEFSSQHLLATWEDMFQFPLEFDWPDNTLLFGLKAPSSMIEISNLSDVPCGLRVTFEALTDVAYPRLVNVTNQTHLELNLVLHAHERAIVDNMTRYTQVYLQRPNELDQNIVNFLTDDSTVPVILPVGTSIFTYSAESNTDSLQVTLEFMPSFLEVL